MDLDTAVKIINTLLEKEQPKTFSSLWILNHAPVVYHYIRINFRTENDHIDWDRFTYALNPTYSKRWIRYKRKPAKIYEDQSELEVILNKHKNKLYTFVAIINADDREIRNRIIVSLVRIAQKGNILAQQELIKWLRYIVDDWVEKYYQLFKWKGYGEEIDEKIKGCIRGYKYTGSFVGYLFKTLEYSARGMRSPQAWSLDDPVGDDGATKVDFVSVDRDTNIATIFGR